MRIYAQSLGHVIRTTTTLALELTLVLTEAACEVFLDWREAA